MWHDQKNQKPSLLQPPKSHITETAIGSGLSESLLLSLPRPQPLPLLPWNLVLLGSLPAPAWDERMVTWAPLGSRQGQASSAALLS